MKEATGSSVMLYILLVFLAVYVMFIAIAVNYARAFKTKNKIIDIIEQSQGFNGENTTDLAKIAIEDYLATISYNINPNDINNTNNKYGTCYERGYCIKRINGIQNDHYYYKATTFIILKVPLVDDLKFEIPVMGETIEMVAIS